MKPKHPHLLTFGALALVMPATADVIYSNLQDIAIPATFDGLYLNVETGAWNTPSNLGAGVAGWDVNPFSGGKAFANSPGFQPVRSGMLRGQSQITDIVRILPPGHWQNSLPKIVAPPRLSIPLREWGHEWGTGPGNRAQALSMEPF